MYNYYYCNKLNDNFYNQKININKLTSLIKEYKLINKGIIKEYWINNVKIISNKGEIKFYKVVDKNIFYKNNYLIQEYEEYDMIPFNFYETKLENEYILYKNTIENIDIFLKKYDDYITIEFCSKNLINNDNFLCYNII